MDDIDKIPIRFEHDGKEYSGHFSKVSGGGSTALFHLYIDKFYYGQLFLTDKYGWKFYSQNGEMDYLSGFFGEYVTAWVQ